MAERSKLGAIPDFVLNAMAKIGAGRTDEVLFTTIKTWVDGDKLRENFVQAWLEPDQDDSGSHHTRPISPTDNGTGLSRQQKAPRDLRIEE